MNRKERRDLLKTRYKGYKFTKANKKALNISLEYLQQQRRRILCEDLK